MKNKKLNLNELRVKSFVTSFQSDQENTIKGGGPSNLCSPGGATTYCNSFQITACVSDNPECKPD